MAYRHQGDMITHNLSFEKMLVMLYMGDGRWSITVGEHLFFMKTDEMKDLADKVLSIIEKKEPTNAS